MTGAHSEKGKWPSELLPKSWIWAEFADFFTDRTDSRRKLPKSRYNSIGQYPVIDQGEELIGGYSDDGLILSPITTPCIVWGDHTRCVKYIDGPFIQGADGVKVLEPTEAVDAKFSHKAMLAIQLPDKGYSRHFKFLRSSKFPLPPLAEQRRIVAKLDALTDRLARARAELARVPKLAASLRQQTLQKVFSSPLRIALLGDLTSFVTSGSRGWAKYYADSGPAFIRVGDVRRRNIRLDLHDLQHVRPPDGSEGVRTALRMNDIVVTITADLGRVGVVPNHLGPAFVNQHVALARPVDAREAEWIAWYLSSEDGQRQLLAKDRGVTKAGLGLDDIRNVNVPLVESHERDMRIAKLNAAFARADRLDDEAACASALLDRLEASILGKAFRGELVLQDSADEPASILLEHIRGERAGGPPSKRKRSSTG